MSAFELTETRSAIDRIDRAPIIAEYKRRREASKRLNNKLTARLTKADFDEGGRRLGLMRKGILVFGSENEMAVMNDYCLYELRRNGRNVIEQFLIDGDADPESEEMVCLRAMQHSIYSVFVIETVESGFGITVRDLLSDRVFVVVDIGLGGTADPGVVMASRLIEYGAWTMTGGAALPIGVADDQLSQSLRQSLRKVADSTGRIDPTELIRTCLRSGSSSRVAYQGEGGLLANGQRSMFAERPTPLKLAGPKVGRNDPCPCGSGKKFKTCCHKRG